MIRSPIETLRKEDPKLITRLIIFNEFNLYGHNILHINAKH